MALPRCHRAFDQQGGTYTYDPATLALTDEIIAYPPGAGATPPRLTRVYDALGRPAGIAMDGDYAVTYAYDGVGRFAGIASAIGTATTTVAYARVPNSDLLAGHSLVHAGATGTLSVARHYEQNRDLLVAVSNRYDAAIVSAFDYINDAAGRRTRRVDALPALPSLTNAFGYNPRSEVVTANMGTNTYGYAYDPIGNRTAATNNAETIAYLANALNQYTNIVREGEAPAEPQCDPDGNLTNDGAFVYGWDAENRLIAATPLAPTNGARRIACRYDHQSRRTGKSVLGWQAASNRWIAVSDRAFLYDGWNLLEERRDTLVNLAGRAVGTYSPVHDGLFGLPTSIAVSGDGRTAWLRGNAWKQAAFAYTLTTNTVLTLDMSTTNSAEIIGIGFDTDNDFANQRRCFTLSGSQTDTWTWAYNNWYVGSTNRDWKSFRIPVGQFYTGAMNRLVLICDEDRTNRIGDAAFRNIRVFESNAVPADTHAYTWGLDLSGTLQGAGGIGGLLYMSSVSGLQSAVNSSVCDANGNITEYVDATGQTVAHYEFGAFGELLTASGAKKTDFRFRLSSKYSDDETGLVYYGYRYHNPELGRWLSRDPIGERGGRNVYGFIANSPIAFVDYLGLLVVYIGGAMEETQGQLPGFQKDVGADVSYGWNQGAQVLAKIKETIKANPCEPIIVIGHSWGGDTALDVADDLGDEKCLKCLYVVTLDPVSQLDPNAWFGGPNPGKQVTEWINIAQPAGLMDVIFDIPVVGWIAGGLWAGGSAVVGSNNGVATGGGQWNAESQATVNIPAVGSDGKTLDHHDVAGMMNLTMPGKSVTVKQYIDSLKSKDCCK